MEDAECPSCRVLRDWIDREIQEKEYFREVLFTNARLVKPDEVAPTTIPVQEFQSTNRHIPFRIRRAKKEAEQRAKSRNEPVETSPNLSLGEQLFQAELEKVTS